MTAFRQALILAWNRRKGSRGDFNAVSLHIQSIPEPSLQGWTAEAEQHSAHRGQAEATWRNGTARDAYRNGRRRIKEHAVCYDTTASSAAQRPPLIVEPALSIMDTLEPTQLLLTCSSESTLAGA